MHYSKCVCDLSVSALVESECLYNMLDLSTFESYLKKVFETETEEIAMSN